METIPSSDALPALDSGAIHIWGVQVSAMRDRLDRLASLLRDGEREKAGRFRRAVDREASVAARGALRVLLAGYTGMEAGRIDFAYSPNGKPHLPDAEVAFNVSHSGDWVVLAFGRCRNIGVDIEAIRRDLEILPLAMRCFSEAERGALARADDPHAAFFQLWAFKEAYVKASGSTLFRELGRCAVPAGDGERNGWHFRRLEAGSKYAAAVVTDRPVGAVPCYDFGGLQWRN